MRERRTGRRGGGSGGEGLCGAERTCPTLWQPRARAGTNTPAMEKFSKVPSRSFRWPAPSPSRRPSLPALFCAPRLLPRTPCESRSPLRVFSRVLWIAPWAGESWSNCDEC